MTYDGYELMAGLVIIRIEKPTEQRLDFEDAEEVAGDPRNRDLCGSAVLYQVQLTYVEASERGEAMAETLPIVKIWNVRAHFIGHSFEVLIGGPDVDELLGMAIG